MPDYGHRYADKKLSEIDKKLKKTYRQAQKEMKAKLADFNKRFEARSKEMRQDVASGRISQQDYREWLQSKVFVRSLWQEKINQVSRVLYDHNQQSLNLINNSRLDVFAENYNYLSYIAEKKLVGSFTLYNAEAVARLLLEEPDLLPKWKIDKEKDYAWDSKKINNVITQGIIQGESVPQITDRLCEVLGSQDEDRMRTFARTAITGAENAGRQEQMNTAAGMGIKVNKRWEAVHDNRTRDSHRAIDGEEVPYNEDFSNGLEYPGDPSGDPAEVYNCRCTMLEIFPEYEDYEASAKRHEDLEIDGQSYDEWKKFDSYDDWKKYKEEKKSRQEEKPTQYYSISGIEKPVRPNREDFTNMDDYYAARDKYREDKKEYDQKIEQEIEKALSMDRFGSKEEVAEWAKANGVELSEDFLEKMDMRAMGEITTTLDDMFRRFPEAKEYSVMDFDGSFFKSTYRLDMQDDSFMSECGGISFFPGRFNDYEQVLRDALFSAADGHNVMGDGTFGVMIRHEYGHRVESYIQTKVIGKDGILSLDDWRTHYPSLEAYRRDCDIVRAQKAQFDRELRTLSGLKGSSEYSNATTQELFAEGFAEWSSGGNTEFGIKFGEFFGRWYR